MKEGEFPGLTPIEIIPTHVKINRFVAEAANRHELKPLTAEALGKFAFMNFRIKQVSSDFRGTSLDVQKYPGWTGGAGNRRLILLRDEYQEFLNIVSTTTFNLYNSYLSTGEKSRTAARKVQVFVNDLI